MSNAQPAQVTDKNRHWKAHLVLAALTVGWLLATEYVVDVPYPVVLLCTALIVCAGGVVTSICCDRAARHHRREARAARTHAAESAAEQQRIIDMLPALYALYWTFFQGYARGRLGMCNFAHWLKETLGSPDNNLSEWLQALHATGGYTTSGLPQLYGVLDEVPHDVLNRLVREAQGRIQGEMSQYRMLAETRPNSGE